MAAAHGLDPLVLPSTANIQVLGMAALVDGVLSSLLAPLDNDPEMSLCVSLDAEWNVSRTIGVSILQIAPHLDPNLVYIIPVSILFNSFHSHFYELHFRFISSKTSPSHSCNFSSVTKYSKLALLPRVTLPVSRSSSCNWLGRPPSLPLST